MSGSTRFHRLMDASALTQLGGIAMGLLLLLLVPGGSWFSILGTFALAGFAMVHLGLYTYALLSAKVGRADRRYKHLRRVFLSIADVVVVYALVYKALQALDGAEGALDYLYFSIVTFTTLGYGDLAPLGLARGFAASEALIGFIFVPILVAEYLSILGSRSALRAEPAPQLAPTGPDRKGAPHDPADL